MTPMEPQAARPIIDALAQGLHPVTGEPLADDSVFQVPGVIRALHAASAALGRPEAAPKSRAAAPANAGKPWSAEDDAALAQAHEADPDLRRLAAALGRSRFAIEQRLIRLGRIRPPPGGGRYGGVAAPAA